MSAVDDGGPAFPTDAIDDALRYVDADSSVIAGARETLAEMRQTGNAMRLALQATLAYLPPEPNETTKQVLSALDRARSARLPGSAQRREA